MNTKRPWIRVIEPEQADGALREVYEETAKGRGRLAEVHKIHSLNPASLRAHMGLYMTLMFGSSPLSRRERELIAVAVSRTNGCAYCVAHHSDALARYEKDAAILRHVQEGRWEALTPRDAALCRFVEKLTRSPGAMAEADLAPLRQNGLDDAAILDTAQIASYFNFVNRLVLGLGVKLEEAAQRNGYRY